MIDKSQIPAPGTLVTATLITYFGSHITIKGTIMSEPFVHGYRTKCGAWALYADAGDVPCHHVKFRPYRKKTARIIPVDEIVDMKVGWGQ